MKTLFFIILIGCSIFASYGQGSPNGTITITTPKGTQIICTTYSELSAADISSLNAAALTYSDVELLAPATFSYNCHGYAWSMREGKPACWLEEIRVPLYVNDQSFNQLTTVDSAGVILYVGDHSVVKSLVASGKYESKWSQGPLMRHPPGVGPPYVSNNNPQYYRSTALPTISGPSSTFTGVVNTFVVEHPPLYSYSWDYSSNLSAGATSVHSKKFTATGSGSAWVRIMSNGSQIARKEFTVQTITGPATVCAGAQAVYTVSNPPSGYSWARSGNLTAGTASGSTYTVTASTTPGSAAVSIVSGGSTIATKSISVVALPASRSITGYPYFYVNEQGYYEVSPKSVSNETVTWSITPTTGVSVGDMHNGSVYIVPNDQGRYYGLYELKATITSSNGCTNYSTTTLSIVDHPLPSAAAVFPNPVDDVLTVDLDAITAISQSKLPAGLEATTAAGQSKLPTYDIRIYDAQGNMQRQATDSNGGSITFNLSNLPDGSYFLHIYDGIKSTPEIYKILVKH